MSEKSVDTGQLPAGKESPTLPCSAELCNIYWVHLPKGEIDGINEAQDRCRKCCDAAVEKLKSKYPELDVSADGGWDAGREVEWPAQCEDCGAPLAGYLLETWMDDPEEWTDEDRCLYDFDTWKAAEEKL